MTVPASPPAVRRRVPSWFDVRFALGVLLVLVSVLVGACLFAVADRTVRVWAVVADLGAGTVLARADLVAVPVRLPDSAGRYLAASGPAPVGHPLARDVGAGELLPLAALAGRVCGSEVSIPVNARHMPATVTRGVRVDVFATPRSGESGQVLAAVTVQAVVGSGLVSAAGESALVVRIADVLASAVVRVVRTAEIDVVIVAGPRAGAGCGVLPAGTGTPSPGAASSTAVPPAGPRQTPNPTTTGGGG